VVRTCNDAVEARKAGDVLHRLARSSIAVLTAVSTHAKAARGGVHELSLGHGFWVL
jgi:hypothetical protein